ncbi:MAG: hypothetical protein A2X12_08810 [Bacteroidetes bacterium GWE2_29_8]|nr:MAG: hypothetical protein A2X12_08810 [Bacteroidetes bacterium GWE2_29_8]OFY18345.1 MAG: hypothetical protein A2X02_08380 [Bacteroidetes bacterium GWF2_29_10]
MSIKQLISFIGSLVIIIGVFMPIMSIPMLQITVSYFEGGKGDGVYVLIFVLISIIFTLLKNYKYIWISIVGIIGTMSYSYFNINSRKLELENLVNSKLENNPIGEIFQSFAELAINSVKIEWGWIIIIFGVLIYVLVVLITIKDLYLIKR